MTSYRQFAGPLANATQTRTAPAAFGGGGGGFGSPTPWGGGGGGGGGGFGTPKPPEDPAPAPSGGAFWGGGIEGRQNGSYNATRAGSDGSAPGWAADTIRNRYTDAMNRTGSLAEQAEGGYLDRAMGFDARDYLGEQSFDANAGMATAARGVFDQFMPELERSIGEMRGSQVGMGRLNTGFATEDEDRLVSQGLNDLTSNISQLALQGQGLNLSHMQGQAGRRMQAAGMNMENAQGIGRYGAEYGGRYLDLVSGQLDRKYAEQNAKKFDAGGWLNAGATVAGMFI